MSLDTSSAAAERSASDRALQGKQRREAVSRQAHKDLRSSERQFDPIDILLEAESERLRRLLPIKYARMKESPFAFFRGAVSLMAADLARLPNSGIDVQLCGDAHVQNLGSFAAPDGNLVFDLNDFDETIRGPFEWDLKRMAASLVLAGRESGHDAAACKSAAEAFARSYCRFIAEFARQPVLQAARHQVRRGERAAPIHAALRQSQRARPLDLLKKLTEPGRRGRPRFRDQRPLFWRLRGPEAREVLHSLDAYRQSLGPERVRLFDLFASLDVGFKVVGTGSIGLRDYVVLFEGNGPRDPLFLQVKQEVASTYAKYLPDTARQHQGQRVAQGQRAMQPLSDLMLGWTTIGSHEFLVRQLNDHKGRVDLQRLRGGGLESLALVAGELLARGHGRSGDACQVSGYCGSGGKVAKALAAFAAGYADQTEADYRVFRAAIRSGRIEAARNGAGAH